MTKSTKKKQSAGDKPGTVRVRNQQHLFPIIDAMVEAAIEEIEPEKKISCHAGCDHCCHLLVEISWSEAFEMADWVMNKVPRKDRDHFLSTIGEMAAEARNVLGKKKSGRKFLQPLYGDDDIPDWAYDDWFYEKKRPCPFLKDGLCAAYEVRPSPCRLHLVTSDPALCKYDVEDDSDYEVPDELEEVKEELGPVIAGLNREGAWGQLAIMLEAVLEREFGVPCKQ